MRERRGLPEDHRVVAENQRRGANGQLQLHSLAGAREGELQVDVVHAVDSAYADHTADVLGRPTHFFEVGLVGSQQGGQVPTRRMPTDEKLARVAAVIFTVAIRPGEGPCDVLDVLRVTDARREAVVRQDYHKPPLGEATGDGAVAVHPENVVLAARDPAAAVQ